MKKGKFFCLFVITFLILGVQFASAAITLQQETVNDVVIKEVSQPAKFLITVRNTASTPDYIEFYTFVDVMLSPKGAIRIEGGEEKKILLEVYPGANLRDERKGSYTFVYYLKSQQQEPIENRLVIRILPLKDLLAAEMPSIITLDTTQFDVSVENRENLIFNNTVLKLKSAFIDSSKEISLSAFEKTNVTFELDAEKLKNILAGKYITTISFTLKEASFSVEKEIDIREKSNIVTTEKESGSIFYPLLKITKENQGNVVTDVDIVIRKNIFANTFTVFSSAPSEIEKSAAFYTYKWHATLKPKESLSVEIRTNYLLPLGILLAIVLISAFVALYLQTPLVINKRVIRVKSKTGEFALKVIVNIKARKNLTNLALRERIPHLAELHERYGTLKPSSFDKQRRILTWEIPELKKGEEHIISYVVYSKVAVLGGYKIPNAFATFNVNGKSKTASSNKVIFLSEEHVPM
jgi:hypothetical protein